MKDGKGLGRASRARWKCGKVDNDGISTGIPLRVKCACGLSNDAETLLTLMAGIGNILMWKRRGEKNDGENDIMGMGDDGMVITSMRWF